MATRKTKKARQARVPPITADRLIRGWSGPARTVIRLARPSDLAEIRDLLTAADLPLDPDIVMAVEGGTCASTLLLGLRRGREEMLRPLAEAAFAGEPERAMSPLAMVLVAEHQDGGVHGVLQCMPPGNVLADAFASGVPLPVAVIGAVKIAKVQALAVAEAARGNGIAATMLRRAIRLYTQLDFLLIYGQFSTGRGLEAFYTRQGFTVLPEGAPIDLDRITIPVAICHEPGERLFVRWRP